MFLAGGTCLLLIGQLEEYKTPKPLFLRVLAGAGIITAVELASGLLVNRDYRVWDYRHLPLNFHGQICLRFFLLWIPLSLGAMGLYKRLQRHLAKLGRSAA